MKVLITNKYKTWDNATTGKGKFIRRLIPALKKLDVEVTADPDHVCDIQLGIGKFVQDSSAAKKVLRLANPHFFKRDHRRLNKPKKQAFKDADGIIFQSEFCQKMARSFFGKQHCPETVIYNGVDPDVYNVSKRPKQYRHNFMCSAREWTDQKRLQDIQEAFWEADIRSSCLYVCGYVSGKNMTTVDNRRSIAITHTGLLGDKALAHYLRIMDMFINITYLDACPNAVVEALAAGCPVFCCPDGGTIELVKLADPDGKTMPHGVFSTYNYKPVSSIPHFPTTLLTKTFAKVARRKHRTPIDSKPFHIDNTAKQYTNFFNEVLCQK